MAFPTFIMGILAVLTGLLVATGLLVFWIRENSPQTLVSRSMMLEAEDGISFLFDGEVLLNATPHAAEILAQNRGSASDWENVVSLLSARFPHLRSDCKELATKGRLQIRPSDGLPGWIDAEYWNGLAKLTLEQEKPHPDDTIDPLTAAAIEHELETLRCIGEDSPQLIWKRDADGVLTWANRAYIELTEALFPVAKDAIRSWPPPDIFSQASNPVGAAPVFEMHRLEISEEQDPMWYEITSVRRNTDTIHFAVDASAVVNARKAQAGFIQTLSKTFAELSVGLAIFDTDRKLVMFNPAVTDLTTLSPEFLISRPTLRSFLDRLRDRQMIPEPKNYANWRDQIADLESAAREGTYSENWLLPNGQTYRVTGQPHPNGAIALLIEDVSDAVAVTRRFRAQIETSQAVLDKLELAICVFSPTGTLTMANSAYRQLWGREDAARIGGQEINDEAKIWQSFTQPTPIWVRLETAVLASTRMEPWSDSVPLEEETNIACHYEPLPDGSHLVTFALASSPDQGTNRSYDSDMPRAG